MLCGSIAILKAGRELVLRRTPASPILDTQVIASAFAIQSKGQAVTLYHEGGTNGAVLHGQALGDAYHFLKWVCAAGFWVTSGGTEHPRHMWVTCSVGCMHWCLLR